jgi:hypothetical protein
MDDRSKNESTLVTSPGSENQLSNGDLSVTQVLLEVSLVAVQ